MSKRYKVDHDTLLHKLHTYGLAAADIQFFISYLQNRYFCVKHDGNTSGKFKANSGVPQGSNLGPILFLIFINDLPEVITHSNCLLFADDMKFYREIGNLSDSLALQADINSVYEWSHKNKLNFNISKCFVMSLTLRTSKQVSNYTMNGEILDSVEHVKDLGVHYNTKLKFDVHIESTKKQALRNLGFIIRQSYGFRNIQTIKML